MTTEIEDLASQDEQIARLAIKLIEQCKELEIPYDLTASVLGRAAAAMIIDYGRTDDELIGKLTEFFVLGFKTDVKNFAAIAKKALIQ